MGQESDSGRVPAALRPHVDEIVQFTDTFCAEHLDAEYAQLCRKLTAKLARKRPSPLVRGNLRIWAASIIYAVGQINFLFDRSQTPHLTYDQISEYTGVPKSTLGNKAKLIRDLLKLDLGSFEFQRRALLRQNPLAWMVMVNGIIMDVRRLPPEVQEECRRRGLVPDLGEEVEEGEDENG